MAGPTRGALTEGPVGPTLIAKALPMLVGIASILLFNIVDTFFVGQLGAEPLAAMSFTFPVTFVVLSLAMGIGIGATAVISTALGQGDDGRVRRLTTDALFLANVLVIVCAGLGLSTQSPLFRALGADPRLLPLILQYMTPWWFAVGFLVIPMVGNAAIRATGDMKTPSYVMLTAGLVNLALDPILIFGWGPVPRLELFGAALATGLAWVVTFVAAVWILARRERMLTLERPRLAELLASWTAILRVGVPAALTNVLTPVAGAALTRLAAGQGTAAVAAWGVGTRIEGLATVGVMALATALTPFVGQNIGAGRCDRLSAALRFAVLASIVWGAGVALVLGILARPLALAFNDDGEVVAWIMRFLWVVPASYTFLGAVHLMSSFYNGAQRPLPAAALSVVRLFVLGLPAALLGAHLGGMTGLLQGVAVGNVLAGVVAIGMGRRLVAEQLRRQTEERAPVPALGSV